MTTSRKRKTRNPNQEEEIHIGMLSDHTRRKQSDGDSSELGCLPKKPKILRLFGVNIPIDHLQNKKNPNQEEEEEEEEEEAPPPIPRIVAHHPFFLFEKELTFSDVARSHNRLLITGSHRLMAALTEEERGKVELNKGDYLSVVTTDTNGDEYTLRLKKWAASGAIVLKHEWGKLVRANGLHEGDSVQGWGYRVAAQFRLALSIIRKLN